MALKAWWDDNVPRMGAALAYYTLIALAPVLFVAIFIGGMMFGADAVRGEIVGQIDQLVGKDGAEEEVEPQISWHFSEDDPNGVINYCTEGLEKLGAMLEELSSLGLPQS